MNYSHAHIYMVRKPFTMKMFTTASRNFPLDSKDILDENGKMQMYHFSSRIPGGQRRLITNGYHSLMFFFPVGHP